MLKHQTSCTAALLLVAAAFSPLALAQTTECQQAPSVLDGDGGSPVVQSLGELRYVSGGIGADEAAALRALRQQYPLALSFAERNAAKNAFVASVYVSITRADGQAMGCIISSGPYLFIDLPAGTYRVTANAPQRSELVQQVKIAARQHRDVAMIWTTPRPDTGMKAAIVPAVQPVIIRTVVTTPARVQMDAAPVDADASATLTVEPVVPETPAAPAAEMAPPAP